MANWLCLGIEIKNPTYSQSRSKRIIACCSGRRKPPSPRSIFNGRVGLELFQERPADLIITDIVMPEMNGLEMMWELSRRFLNVKIIAISGCPATRAG